MTGNGAEPGLTTRLATAEDADAIARIQAQGVAERIATFATRARTAEMVAKQLAEEGSRYPTVVEIDAEVVGWAAVGPYLSTPRYAGIGEHSVYVDQQYRGCGVGLAALNAPAERCAERGFWKLVSRIFQVNAASLHLHQRAGFRAVGVYERHGQLNGIWRDCVIVEKLLGDGAAL